MSHYHHHHLFLDLAPLHVLRDDVMATGSRPLLRDDVEPSQLDRKSPGAQRPGGSGLTGVRLGSKCSHWLNFSFRPFEKPEFMLVPWLEL